MAGNGGPGYHLANAASRLTGAPELARPPSHLILPRWANLPRCHSIPDDRIDHATLGSWSGSNPTYGSTAEILGVAVIAGNTTVLVYRPQWAGDERAMGSGTADATLDGTTAPEGGPYCYDPTNSYKTVHAYPYRYQVWAYDLNELAAVKAGEKYPLDAGAVWSVAA